MSSPLGKTETLGDSISIDMINLQSGYSRTVKMLLTRYHDT